MTDIDDLAAFEALIRPRMLVGAARHALPDWRRDRDLRRVLRRHSLPASGRALAELLVIEHEMETKRRDRDAAWSAAAHVEILAAMMDEARTARARDLPQQGAETPEAWEDQAKASGMPALRRAT